MRVLKKLNNKVSNDSTLLSNDVQTMHNKLCIDGSSNLSMNKIIKEITKEENLRIKQISLKHFDRSSISPMLKLISNSHLNLEILTIRDSAICSDSAWAIANFVENHALSKLKIIKGEIMDGALITIINSISKSSLKKIYLANCIIGMNEAEAMVNAMRTSLLSELAFVSCTCRANVMPLILSNIRVSTVRTLILERSTFDIDSTDAIIDMISDCNYPLIKLSLAYSGFEIVDYRETRMREIINGSSLVNLNVDSTIFHGRGGYAFFFQSVEEIIELLNSPKIEKFRFGYVFFGIPQTVALVDVLAQNTLLKHIHLIMAFNSDYFCDKVCNMIECTRATTLTLNLRVLSLAQFNRIIASIKKSSIVSLKLVFNRANFDVITMCDLITNHALIKLDLRCDGALDDIVKTILIAIKGSTLAKFNCNKKGINKDTLKEIKSVLHEQQKIASRFRKTKSAMSVSRNRIA